MAMLLQAAHAICPGAKKTLRIGDNKTGAFCTLTTDVIINAAGLQAQEVAAAFVDFPRQHVPRRYLARGCYFTLSGMLHSSHATWTQALLKRGSELKVLERVQPFGDFTFFGHSPACSGCQFCTLSAVFILCTQGWCLREVTIPAFDLPNARERRPGRPSDLGPGKSSQIRT